IPLPPEVSPSFFETKLVAGECAQGFLTSKFIPSSKKIETFVPQDCTRAVLASTLARFRNLRLGSQLDEDGFAILMEDGGLKEQMPDYVARWKEAKEEVENMRQGERSALMSSALSEFALIRAQLVREVKVRLSKAIVDVYPHLKVARILKSSLTSTEEQMTDRPELLQELHARYPSLANAERRIIEGGKIAYIDSESYKRIKARLLDKQDILLESEKLSSKELKGLMDIILKDGSDEGLLAKIYRILAWNPVDRRSYVYHRVSDQQFLATLTEVVSQKPKLMPFLKEMVRSVIYPWVSQKLENLTQKVIEKIEAMYVQGSEDQARIHSDAKAQTEMTRRLSEFKRIVENLFTTDSEAVCLTINKLRRKRYGYGAFTTFEVIGHWESVVDPCIQYTLFPLNLTESDKAGIQENSLFLPRPKASIAAAFKLSVEDSVRHIQFIGNKILLIVDTPSFVNIWLSDRSRIANGRPTKQLPRLERRYHFAISEQRRLFAIVYTDLQGHPWLQLQSFDETLSSLQGRGSPVDVSQWYQDGPPNVTHVCFAGGPEEICLMEKSGRARIYSFVSQGFRAAILQVPPEIGIHSIHSAIDNSSMILVEKDPIHGHQFRVYHWNSFGQLPQGFSLAPPDGLFLHSATAFGVTSIVQKSNVALVALLPNRNTMRCLNVQIKTKNTSYSFKSKDERNIKVLETTVHNSLIDCYSDVWARFPVVSAIKRETITTCFGESPSLTFICHHDSHLLSSYFKQMIREFEETTKKPTEGLLNSIKVSAAVTEQIDWCNHGARKFKSGEWFVELLCLIPIHIAVAQFNGFVPLKDGVLDPIQEQRLLGATVDQIITSISLGWYESIFSSYMATKPVKVISSMGEQSVGKSFALNHVVDSSFAGSALRTTEGVWLSVCPTKDTLVVALDFEGVHSIERSPQEDMLLVLFNTAISNMVLFRNNFAISRDVANMFTSFQASTALLDPAANPNLFKSLLTIIIKDVVEGDKKEIVKEFSSKFSQIVCDEQEANFITVLHDSQLSVIPWPVIQSRSFYTLFGRVRALLLRQPPTHATAGEFLLTLKTLMAKLKAQDWGAIDQNLARHRVSLVNAVLPSAIASGYAELVPEPEELRNLDNQGLIPWGDDTRGITFCLARSPIDRAAPLANLVKTWKEEAARYSTEDLSNYLEDLVSRRLSRIQDWVKCSVSRFPAENPEIRSLKSTMEDYEEQLRAGILLCLIGCSSCHLPCLLPRGHDPARHDCQTSHQCVGSCEYVDQHFEDEIVPCGLLAGHAGRHLCDPISHSCGEPCKFSGYKGCQHSCAGVPGHPVGDGHVCSANRHQCNEPCSLRNVIVMSNDGNKLTYTCPKSCSAAHDEKHDVHVCGDNLACPIKCELCNRLCTMGDHLHGLDDSELHLCHQKHDCPHLCEAPGICRIETEPKSIETTFVGAHETFQFTKYTQIANRLRCVIPIEPGHLGHIGAHSHSTAPEVFHFCDAECKNCGYICHLPLNHPQAEHDTKHGSMQNTSWAIEGDASAVIEIQGRKYAARDAGTPHICSSVCSQIGRHAHIDYCRSPDGSCQGNESLHIKERMLPNSHRPKDWISHKLFWERTGFKDPYSREEQAEFARCDVQCSGKEHEATLSAPERPSFCTLPIFHPPQPLDWAGAGNGYVSADGHAFSCVNPSTMHQAFHVIFVLDRSSSMGGRDRQPLANTPSASTITANNNNRFGAVLSALLGFWLSRWSNNATRRDAYSVIVFNSTSQVVLANDFVSSPEVLLSQVASIRPNGGTHFDGALKMAQTTMENHWATDRAPVVIFLSDGECQVSDPVIHDICNRAVALGKALSFHAVSFGDNQWSQPLRKMVTIAEQIAKNAPRDPLTQVPQCGYTDAIDTIRLAETFLQISRSLHKPKASLIYSSAS
ncbi:hypothetical protein FRC03_012004, partial [Tulasnella sp. 419]